MKVIQIVVWGLGVTLVLLILSLCYVGCKLPYGPETLATNINITVMDRLLLGIVGILALFSVLIKELMPPKDPDKK